MHKEIHSVQMHKEIHGSEADHRDKRALELHGDFACTGVF